MAEYSQTVSSPKAWKESAERGIAAPKGEMFADSAEMRDINKADLNDGAAPKFSFPLSDHTGVSLRNLVNMMYTYSNLINRAIGSHFYVYEELPDVLKGLDLDGEGGIHVVKMALKDVAIESHPVYGTALISGLSITENNVCFDGFAAPETDDPSLPYFEEDYIEACRQLAESMNRAALNSIRVQAKTLQTGNDKYLFHTWLNRLGMKGNEYKTSRKVLTYRLDGFMSHKTEDALIRATGRTASSVKYKKKRPAIPQPNQEKNSADAASAFALEKLENYDTERPQERMIMSEDVKSETAETDVSAADTVQAVPMEQSLSAYETDTNETAGDAARETETLPALTPETLLEIASVGDKDELVRREAEVRANLGQIEAQSGQLEKSISKITDEINSIEEKISNLEVRLGKKRNSLQALQTQFNAAKQSRSLKMQELTALEKQQRTVDAHQLFDAFIASGKSMEEILNFLHGQQSEAALTDGQPSVLEPVGALPMDDTEKDSAPEQMIIADQAVVENGVDSEKPQEENAEIESSDDVSEVASEVPETPDKAFISAQLTENSTASAEIIPNAIPDETKESVEVYDEIEPSAPAPDANIVEDTAKDPDAERTDDVGKSKEESVDSPSKTRRKRGSLVLPPDQEQKFQSLWQEIVDAQGEEFYTMKGLPFQYEVRGRQIFVNRKGKAITESSLRLAFHQIEVGEISGPHSLKTFGASYVWSIFKKFGIVNI